MSRLEMSFTGPGIRPASRSSTPSAIGTLGSASTTEATLSDSWMPDYDVPSQGQRAPTPDADSRTEWRCCEPRADIDDSLEYESILSSLFDASQQNPLDRIFEAYERRRIRLECINSENSSQRMELWHRLDKLEQHLDRLQTSVEPRIVQPSATATTDSNVSQKKPRARRRKLHASTNLDLEALRVQIHDFDLLTEELRWQEDAEKAFDNAVLVMSAQLRMNNLLLRDEEVLVACAPTFASISGHPNAISLPIEAELEHYYAAIATLRNTRERIADLQVEQQDQWVRRGLTEDQDGSLELGTPGKPQFESPHRETNTDRSQSQQRTLACPPHVTVPIFGICHQAPWELMKHK
jgi:hypothetical protein